MFKTFIENRRLVRDLRTADAVHMIQLDEISDLKKALSECDAKSKKEIDRTADLLIARNKEIRELRDKLREQTGADLLVNALRELGVIPKPEKYDAYSEQSRLLRQSSNAQEQGSALRNQLGGQPQSLMGSIFGGP